MDQDALNFRNLLEEEINKRVNYDQDLIERERQVQSRINAMPAELREEFNTSAIRDPFAQERIIAQRRGSAQSELGFLNSLRERRGSRYADILGRSSDTFNAILADRERARAGSGGSGGVDYGSLLSSIFGGGEAGQGLGTSNSDLEIEIPQKASASQFLKNRYGSGGLFSSLARNLSSPNIGKSVDAAGRLISSPEAGLVNPLLPVIGASNYYAGKGIKNIFNRFKK